MLLLFSFFFFFFFWGGGEGCITCCIYQIIDCVCVSLYVQACCSSSYSFHSLENWYQEFVFVRCFLSGIVLYIQQEDFDDDVSSSLATCLCQILSNQFNNQLFPQEVDEEYVTVWTCTSPDLWQLTELSCFMLNVVIIYYDDNHVENLYSIYLVKNCTRYLHWCILTWNNIVTSAGWSVYIQPHPMVAHIMRKWEWRSVIKVWFCPVFRFKSTSVLLL